MEDEDDLDAADDPPLRFGTAAPRPPRRPPNAREGSEEQPRRRSPLKPLGYSVATILAFYVFLAMTLNQRPETALDFLRRIPLLGRMVADDNLLVIPDSEVSSRHCVLNCANDRVDFQDLGSSNGSFLNDQPFRQGRVNSGDTLRLGRTTKIFFSFK